MQICVEGGSADQRAVIARALGALGCEIIPGSALRVAIAPVVRVDALAGAAIIAGRRVRLTRIELALLACLIDAGRPIARSELIARVWGYGFDPGTNIVAVHVSRLRVKLSPMLTIAYRAGYLIEVEPSPAAPVRTPRNRTPGRRCS